MLVHHDTTQHSTYTSITEMDGKHASMLMNFALLTLEAGERYTLRSEDAETALLLMTGEVVLDWGVGKAELKRSSLIDEVPQLLHFPRTLDVAIHAQSKTEFAVQQTKNMQDFAPTLYTEQNIRNEYFGKGTLQETSTRNVRTIFDSASAPHSNMVIGEVVNYPGRWSSYPPHNHPQPEIYHYRFFPEHGFGYGEAGDNVYKLVNKSTLLIDPWVTHPQCSAPGYVMYYIWMIPHLPDARFGPDSRIFIDEHRWLLDADAPVWKPS